MKLIINPKTGQQSGGQHGKPTSGQTNNQYGNPTQYQGGYGSTSQQNGYGQPGQRPYGSQYGTQYGQQPGSDYYGNHGYNLRRSPNYFEVGKLILLLLMMRNQEQFQRQVGWKNAFIGKSLILGKHIYWHWNFYFIAYEQFIVVLGISSTVSTGVYEQ